MRAVRPAAALLLLLAPLVVIQLGLVVWALYDLTRPGRRVRGDSKVLWAIVIVVESDYELDVFERATAGVAS